nr:glycine--tRNA ligase subunit beta [Syntrophomonas palmitatica]
MENRGPKKEAAYTADGQPSKAGLGFARGQGMAFEDLEIREAGGAEYLYAVKKEKGQPALQVLPNLLPEIITALVFPKSMRWGYYNTRFARPIRWLLALFDDKVIEFSIDNINSSRQTCGHRFLSKGFLSVKDTAEYFEILKQNYVILNQQERKDIIWKQVVEVAAAQGGTAMENPELLEEVTHLVEYPTAFYGSFSPSYLEVPPEVLTTSMIEHQRYFPVYDQTGKLMPGFIGVKNGIAYSMELVTAGNERVLKARLEDALFFWKEDTKKALQDMVAGLKDVMFHERLGSLMDKVQRLENLAVKMGELLSISNPVRLQRAAYLCKADLLSAMVYEFPELQGIMGRYYALQSHEDQEVAAAILEHYMPRFAGDRLPASSTGIVLSLSEKIDNLVGCFAIGIKPTGSQDPYALRRQALGLVNIILEHHLVFKLDEVLNLAYEAFIPIKPKLSQADTAAELMEFIVQRLRGILLEQGISYDVIDAVFAKPSSDLSDLARRAKMLQQFKGNDYYQDFMVVYNRSHNLSRKWESAEVNAAVLADDCDKELFQAIKGLKGQVEASLNKQNYEQALQDLASLRPVLDRFFTAVMVMAEDESLRNARLGMLKTIANLSHQIADFSKLVD